MTGPPDHAGPPAGGTVAAQQPWQRLDRRMLLVHPVQEVVKFLPAVIVPAIIGVSSGNPMWSLLGVAVVVPYGLAIWFTTTFRVGPTHVELRTGVIQRKRLSVPRTRIRSVDIEADPLHRVLGLAVIVIGTGQEAESDDKFTLDALPAAQVGPLRGELLAHTRTTGSEQRADDTESGAAGPEDETGREIGYWQPSWVRYAPLSLTGFALAASAFGLAAQFGVGATEITITEDTVETVRGFGLVALLIGVVALVAAVLLVSVAACAHYLITYFGLRVTDYGSTLQVRRGLFTLRRITLDTARLRGATVSEPLLLRWAGAAQLEAIMTGENPRQKILPQSPRAAVERTLAELLRPRRNHGADDAAPAHSAEPARIALTAHGRAARRRRYVRACWPVPLSAAVLVLPTGISMWWWLLPLVLAVPCVLLAEDRYRGLGHAVLPAAAGAPTWLIVGSGSLDRARSCLEAPGVLGWTVRQTFWQRRAGLATLSAATAAGKKVYSITDVPLDRARTVIDEVTPGLRTPDTGKPARVRP